MNVDSSEFPDTWSCILIDGDPGSGKTTSGRQLADTSGAKVVSFDDHLAKDGRPYLEQLNYDSLQSCILANGPKVIVEGVCGLKALAKIGVNVDHHIFIERHNGFLGWELGDYLKKGVKPPKSPLTREVVEDYREYKPFEKCDQLLENTV